MNNDSNFCQLWLTCASKTEADKITKALLNNYLIACAKQMPVTSDFHWKGKTEHGAEVLLLMDSRLDLFEDVEKEITKLHSYNTFVLQAVTIPKVSKKALTWFKKEIK